MHAKQNSPANQLTRNEQGIALLLSLVIMAGVTAAGIGMSILIIQELRQAQRLDESIVAYHAAETGIESSLHIVKAERANPTGTLASTVTALTTSVPQPLATSSGTWETTASNTNNDFFETILGVDESTQIDLFDPDSGGGAGVASMEITNWEPNCPSGVAAGLARIEWSVVGWDPTNPLLFHCIDTGTEELCVHKELGICNPGPSGCATPSVPAFDYGFTFDVAQAYRVRLKALTCGANITVRTYDDFSQPVAIPSRIIVTSVGSFQRVQQGLSVNVPWILPLSGLYDYVLFTEEDITKN